MTTQGGMSHRMPFCKCGHSLLLCLVCSLGRCDLPGEDPFVEQLPQGLGQPASARRAAQIPQPACSGPQNWSALLHHLTSAPYDALSRPDNTSATTQVEVMMYLTHFTEVSEKEMKMGVSGYSRAWWTDDRLAYNSIASGGCFDEIDIRETDHHKIWRPDLYFDNSLSESTGAGLLHVYPSGRIWRSSRIKHTFECKMHFGKFPFDSQTCRITIASYSENANKVFVKPFAGTTGVKAKSSLCGIGGWGLKGMSSSLETLWFGEGDARYPWTYVHIDIKLTRHSMFYLREYVGKAVLFVLASWFGLFISPTSAPARVAMGVIPVLTITTLMNSIYAMLPQIDYWTWMTRFLMLCMIYCMIPVFEFGIVCWLLHREENALAKLRVLQSFSSLNVVHALKAFGTVSNDMRRSKVRGTWGSLVSGISGKKLASAPSDSLPSTQPLEGVTPSQNVDAGVPAHGQPSEAAFELLNLSPHQLTLMKQGWHLLDADGHGTVTKQEMRRGMRHFGQYFTPSQIDELFLKLGIKQGEHMDRRWFLELLANYDKVVPAETIVKRFFDKPPSYQLEVVMRWAYISSFIISVFILSMTVSAHGEDSGSPALCSG